MSKCAWCRYEFDDGEEWACYETALNGEPAVARLTIWLTPTPTRFESEPLTVEVHPGRCYEEARDEVRRALFSTRPELHPGGRAPPRLPHGWWHMLAKDKT